MSATAQDLRPVTVPYYVRGLVLGISAYFIGVHLWTWVFMLSTFWGGRADFRQLYTAGYMVRTGHAQKLYDYDDQLRYQNKLVSRGEVPLPFIRPAYEAWIFAPLSVLSYRCAYLIFLAANAGVLLFCYRLLRPEMNNLAKVYIWFPAALFLGFLPLAAALMQGQDSIFFLALLFAAYRLLADERSFLAGLVLGLGAFKFQLLIPIGLLFLLWRKWRFCAGVLITSTIACAISILTVGTAQTNIYIRSLVSFSDSAIMPANVLRYPISPTLMANLHGLVTGVASSFTPARWIQLLTLILSAAVLVAAAFRRPQTPRDALLIALPISVLVSYYLLIHDLSILLLPLVLTLNRNIFLGSRRMLIAAALIFVSPLCISYSVEHFYLVVLPVALFAWTLPSHLQTKFPSYPGNERTQHSYAC
jgi:hypothetical protein